MVQTINNNLLVPYFTGKVYLIVLLNSNCLILYCVHMNSPNFQTTLYLSRGPQPRPRSDVKSNQSQTGIFQEIYNK